MKFSIGVLKGDGVGPEIIDEAIKVLNEVAIRFEHTFEFNEGLIGGAAIDAKNDPFPKETFNLCNNSDSILLGAVGGPKWDNSSVRPEQGLLKIRASLNLYTNLRPAKIYESLINSCVLNENIAKKGMDLLIVRELTSGIYFGEHTHRTTQFGEEATDVMKYNDKEIRRIAIKAFKFAKIRNKKVTSIDKANVLSVSKLWRKIVNEVHQEYKDILLEHMYVDNAAMQLIKEPSQFDVILTSNMFGDILSDEASQITGSIGMLPSASIGETNLGLYEPIHGSAPTLAGKGVVNPIATILSAALMLRYSFSLFDEANIIEKAVLETIETYRTEDIFAQNKKLVTTQEMGNIICSKIKSI